MKDITKTVRKLRIAGLSYGEISKQTGVPKSTLTYWLKNTVVPKKHRARLYTKQILLLATGPHSQKERRKKEVDKIIESSNKEMLGHISTDSLRLMGAALYWAEGSKGQVLEFTNSDPLMVAFFVRWLETFFKITPKELRARLNIYQNQNDKIMKAFWSKLTKIPVSNFTNSFIKQTGTDFRKNLLYHGTIKIYAPKSTDLKHRVYGWIEGVLKKENLNIESLARRWQKAL